MQSIKEAPGCIGIAALVNRETGAGMSVTYWDTQESILATEAAGEKIRAQVLAEGGPQVRDVDRFEVILQERVAPPISGTFVRVNDFVAPPANVDAVADVLRGHLPAGRDLPGFRAVLVSANRDTGRMITLAAGAIGTPAILLRSGIGPADELRRLGITPAVDLPGVGANLIDYPRVTIHLTTRRVPHCPPDIRLNLASNPEDEQRLIEGVRLLCALASTEALAAQHTDAVTLEDGRSLPTTDALAALETTQGAAGYVQRTVSHYVHPVGTARMEPVGDAGAVIDQYGRVHGVEGLRVADASIMPNIPRANTNLTCIMIGERIAEWMRRGPSISHPIRVGGPSNLIGCREPRPEAKEEPPMRLTAAVLRERGQPFVIEELELEEPRGDEVLVRVVGAGICHTDLQFRDRGHLPLPAVLGHEGAGVVERVGERVATVRPGDHVVLSFLSCAACRNCRRGMPAYCTDAVTLNLTGSRRDGSTALCDGAGPVCGHFFGQSSFATHALASERNTVKVPLDAPLELLGPLGCGVQTGAGAVLNALRPTPGSRIAIFGAGSVGLSAVMAAAATGCAAVIAVDLKPARLELARALGATHVLNGAEVDVVEAIRSITAGGADYALETAGAGSPALIRQAVECLATPGVCGLVGAAPPELELTLGHRSLFWGRAVRGIIEGDSVPHVFIPALVELHARGRFPLERLVSFYPLHEINRAAAEAEDGVVVKPVLRPSA